MLKFENYLNNFLIEDIVFYRNDPEDGVVISDKNKAKLTYYSKRNNNKTEYFLDKKGNTVKISKLDYEIARDGLLHYAKKHKDEVETSQYLKNKIDNFYKKNSIPKNKTDILNLDNEDDDFRKILKSVIASAVINNFYKSTKLKKGITPKDVIKVFFKEVPNIKLSKEQIEELKNVSGLSYTTKQKNLIKKLKDEFNKFNSIFNVLKEINLLSDNEEKQIFKSVYKKTELGKLFKILFVDNDIDEKLKNIDKLKNSKEKLKNYFNKKLLDKLSNKFLDELSKTVDNLPENMKKLFKKYGKKINLKDPDLIGDDAYYNLDNNTISFNQFNPYDYPISDFFHESGHFIDNNVLKRNKIFNHNFYSYISKIGKDFVASLMNETKNILKQRKDDFMNLSLDEYAKKYNMVGNCIIEYRKNLLKLYGDNLPEDVLVKTISELYSGEVSQYNAGIDNILKDIVSLSTGGDYYVGGHSLDYCQEYNTEDLEHGDNENTTTEAFAEMTATCCVYPENIDILKKYYPKSFEIYNRIIDEIIK